MTTHEGRTCISRLEKLSRRWAEVDAVEPVREAAERLLGLHPLRAADALQLGAAIVACDHRPRRLRFVCLDDLLAECADREGFRVIVPR